MNMYNEHSLTWFIYGPSGQNLFPLITPITFNCQIYKKKIEKWAWRHASTNIRLLAFIFEFWIVLIHRKEYSYVYIWMAVYGRFKPNIKLNY